MKKALITGINGQDGAYLAGFLLEKGYEVHGIQRPSSLPNTFRLERTVGKMKDPKFYLHHGDLIDSGSLYALVQEIQPDEIYNLAAQSHVGVSFKNPEYTANVNALGALRLLEAIRNSKLEEKCRFYQASTSELYGLVREVPQKETTPFYPRSPYAISKLFAYWITINYREAYGMFACNGILFNHESPLRGETFVTRKITRSLSRILCGLESTLYLGNLDAKRDWGHARDYVEMQWLILQQESPEDFVIASGKQHSVKECVEVAAKELGITLEWKGKGDSEKGVVCAIDSPYPHSIEVGNEIVKVDPSLYRPSEVNSLLGDASKAAHLLGWESKISFEEMILEMVREDLLLAQKECFHKEHPLLTEMAIG